MAILFKVDAGFIALVLLFSFPDEQFMPSHLHATSPFQQLGKLREIFRPGRSDTSAIEKFSGTTSIYRDGSG